MLREHFPSLEPEREEDLWDGEREAPTQQIPKCVCKCLQVGDVSTQVVLIFLSHSILLGPKAELTTCNTVCVLTFLDVLSKESFLSAVILHLLPITLSLSLLNRLSATQHPQQMLNVTLSMRWINYLLLVLFSVLLHHNVLARIYLTYYCFSLLLTR